MPERYVVVVDGCAAADDFVGRGSALRLAMAAIDAMQGVDVAVVDARTLQACAWWRRRGAVWQVRAIEGWLN